MAIDKINPAAAAATYATGQKAASIPGMDAGGVSFGDWLKDSASTAIDTMRGGEKQAAGAVMGKADLTDVVGAITDAETTLSTVIAVRDKMVAAFEEIMRMPM